MFFQVIFYDKDQSNRLGTGVYAQDEDSAREIAAYILQVAHGVSVDPDNLTMVEVDSLESDVPTTT